MIPPVKRSVSAGQPSGIPALAGMVLGLALVTAVGASLVYAVVEALLL